MKILIILYYMQLSDRDIILALNDNAISIHPYDPNRLQPASYDVLLGNEFMIFEKHSIESIDPRKSISEYMKTIILKDDDCFILQPNQFALAVTYDKIGVNSQYAAQINGKSSLARLGLIIHTTAGFIDPGNDLNITLELVNTNSIPIKLYPKMKIAQVTFWLLSSPALRPYGSSGLNSKYYRSLGVQASEMHQNFNVL
jgi:dCTP deaminase